MALGGCLAWLSFSTCPSASPTFSRPVFGGWFRLFLLGGFGSVCFARRLPRLSARAFRLSSCVFNGLRLHSLTILLSLSALTLLSFRGVPASPRASACLSSRLRPWLASDPSRPSEPPPRRPPNTRIFSGFFSVVWFVLRPPSKWGQLSISTVNNIS